MVWHLLLCVLVIYKSECLVSEMIKMVIVLPIIMAVLQ